MKAVAKYFILIVPKAKVDRHGVDSVGSTCVSRKVPHTYFLLTFYVIYRLSKHITGWIHRISQYLRLIPVHFHARVYIQLIANVLHGHHRLDSGCGRVIASCLLQ